MRNAVTSSTLSADPPSNETIDVFYVEMPTRCNRGFYCRSYCLLNMFRAPLCPSSGTQEYYTGLLPVVFRAVVFKLSVWCGAEGYVSGLQDAGLLVNMFRAPLCPLSGAQEYYTVVAACGISCCGFQVVGLVWS